ncbi:NADH-quinone oxidoreductase subunit C [Brockia lithotrophica]|uniref:NADH-quinone oxidoreductase subunit C n=1 Tax=Brockia lithotrophica TaxID=933949 RepID=A0A660KV02_9BACL|nr:NADH-quinone oxidoreductase subunit C [Brockia lithotrophica]RKQ83835.1 NADH/F420H2 dehydrogenase subunit C [Brockia lithotrophica]
MAEHTALPDAQSFLDRVVALLRERFGESAVSEPHVNEKSRNLPTLTVAREVWHDAALLLRDHPETDFSFLNNLHGTDMGSYFDVFYVLQSFRHPHLLAVHVRAERDNPRVPSVVDVWPAADWAERETYDLLGIVFEGHPDLRRILLPEDWVGHPLRKDYVPYDEGV